VAHYISEDNLLEESVLSVQVIEGDHSGENLAKYTMKTIDDYGIAPKLGWLQIDNTPSNDTLIKELSVGIYHYFLFLIRSLFNSKYRTAFRI
jgi:hypothetical protein